MTTNIKGQIAQSKAELRAIELGMIPSKPIFDARYDLILDDGLSLKKIQIKYGDGKAQHCNGAVTVKLTYSNRKGDEYFYNNKEVDGLIVYVPKIDRLCFFPPSVFCGKRKLQIRIEKPKNNQTKNILLAENYLW